MEVVTAGCPSMDRASIRRGGGQAVAPIDDDRLPIAMELAGLKPATS
jgi:hypothetical protein